MIDQCASLKQAPGQPLPQELAVGLDTWTRGCPSLLWAATLRSAPSSRQPRTTRDNPLPSPCPVQGGGWDPGPDALGIFPAGSACLSPLPQAEPGVQPHSLPRSLGKQDPWTPVKERRLF